MGRKNRFPVISMSKGEKNMDIDFLARRFTEYNLGTAEKVGTFRIGNVNTKCRFMHVIQRTTNSRILLPQHANKYINTIASGCGRYGVVPICSIVMPTHTHDIMYADNVLDISRLRSVACRVISQTYRSENRSRGFTVPDHLMERHPRYVAIENRSQLLITMKYVKENDKYLRDDGSRSPYSCFEKWEKNYFKPFCLEIPESLFEITREDLVELLQKPKEEVTKFAERFRHGRYPEEDRLIFFK